MSNRSELILLEDIFEAIGKIQKYTDSMDFNAFQKDDKTIDAVIRNFEVIGEAANRLSADFKEGFDIINWNHLRGFRNRIVHEYFGVDNQIVWSIIENNLEELKRNISGVIEKLKKQD